MYHTRLICANEDDDDEFVARASAACKGKAQKAHVVPVLLSPGTEMLIICPDFWEVAHYPPPGQACPKTVNGKFRAGDVTLVGTGYAYMVLNLVLMYTHETFGRDYTSGDMSAAVELNARQSVLTPINYAFYAGGKLRNSLRSPPFLLLTSCSCPKRLYGLSDKQRAL